MIGLPDDFVHATFTRASHERGTQRAERCARDTGGSIDHRTGSRLR
ncbi:hypothetical protein DB32_002738 [Sandaracinus amylolyticus]|uniref:Uncharacterized protein n=1 Tax=Sandaracinus amylolyticus TaxID=927083 RepID=A0A0F6SEQ2_9BACT|nr:hypothetical protein DB32_002738 [Sandaracinus amylolyticus]